MASLESCSPGKLARLGRLAAGRQVLGHVGHKVKGVKGPAVGPTRRLAILESCSPGKLARLGRLAAGRGLLAIMLT